MSQIANMLNFINSKEKIRREMKEIKYFKCD